MEPDSTFSFSDLNSAFMAFDINNDGKIKL